MRGGILGLAIMIALGGAAWLQTRRAVALPAYGTLPSFQLEDARGGTMKRDDLVGHVHVVDFIFTSCATACPLLTAKMAQLQRDIVQAGSDVQLVSVSVDPERDTAAKLSAYANENGADAKHWRFVRGDEHELRRVVVDGMKQEMEKEPAQKKRAGEAKAEMDDFTILHGTRFVLLDQDARIRGFYDANDKESLAQLHRDMFALAKGRATLQE